MSTIRIVTASVIAMLMLSPAVASASPDSRVLLDGRAVTLTSPYPFTWAQSSCFQGTLNYCSSRLSVDAETGAISVAQSVGDARCSETSEVGAACVSKGNIAYGDGQIGGMRFRLTKPARKLEIEARLSIESLTMFWKQNPAQLALGHDPRSGIQLTTQLYAIDERGLVAAYDRHDVRLREPNMSMSLVGEDLVLRYSEAWDEARIPKGVLDVSVYVMPLIDARDTGHFAQSFEGALESVSVTAAY